MEQANFTGIDDEAAFAELISLLANWDSDSDNQSEEMTPPPSAAAQPLQLPSTTPPAPVATKLQEKWKRQYYGRMACLSRSLVRRRATHITVLNEVFVYRRIG